MCTVYIGKERIVKDVSRDKIILSRKKSIKKSKFCRKMSEKLRDFVEIGAFKDISCIIVCLLEFREQLITYVYM